MDAAIAIWRSTGATAHDRWYVGPRLAILHVNVKNITVKSQGGKRGHRIGYRHQ
jgi:hypothetical protein